MSEALATSETQVQWCGGIWSVAPCESANGEPTGFIVLQQGEWYTVCGLTGNKLQLRKIAHHA